ncbi:MAG: DUF2141 domain-containing protein [Pseudomonadota bacterium]
MPSPSKIALVSGLAVTAGIFFGGAWLASGMTPETSDPLKAQTALNATPTPAPDADSGAQTEISYGELEITVTGARNTNGRIIILVFDKAAAYDAYDYENAAGYAELDAQTAPMTHTFSGLSADAHAVILFHDENENYDLDLVEGYPVEGYGTSNATSAYDELSFQQAVVEPGSISVKIHYLE